MARLAVDIAVIPPESVRRAAIAKNRELVRQFGPKIVLEEDDFAPHITLVMGVLEEARMQELREKLEPAIRRHGPLRLAISGIHAAERKSPEESTSSFAIEKTADLQKLHEDLLGAAEGILAWDAEAGFFQQPPEVRPGSVDFVRKFRQNSAGKNFFPHLTLGKGEGLTLEGKIEFATDGIGLFHLGNYCTCRRKLAEWRLGHA